MSGKSPFKGGDGKIHQLTDVCQALESGTSGGVGTSNRPMIIEKRPRVNPNLIVSPESVCPAVTASNCSKNADNQPWIDMDKMTPPSSPPSNAQLELIPSQEESTSSLSDSLARICRLLESEEACKLTEAVYSLRQCESSGMQSPTILCLKMSRVFSQVTEDSIGLMFSERLPTVGMMVNGNYLIQGGFSPKIERESILSVTERICDAKLFSL